MGLLVQILRPSGLAHGSPQFLSSESSRFGTYGTKLRQQPSSTWQVSFGLRNSNLPYPGELAE
jgi:hypothetical protein